MKKNFVETYKISKTFRAPLDFVYTWCTDFREDDVKMTGEKVKRTSWNARSSGWSGPPGTRRKGRRRRG